MTIKKALFCALATITFPLLCSAIPAQAGNDITIICTKDKCEDVTQLPIFNEENWVPGNKIFQNIILINKRLDTCDALLSITNPTQDPDNFAKMLNTHITRGDKKIYGAPQPTHPNIKNLQDMFDANYIRLYTTPAGQTSIYPWTVQFDKSADNSFQGAHTKFTFDITFKCAEPNTFPPAILENINYNPNAPIDPPTESGNNQSGNKDKDKNENKKNDKPDKEGQKKGDEDNSQNDTPRQSGATNNRRDSTSNATSDTLTNNPTLGKVAGASDTFPHKQQQNDSFEHRSTPFGAITSDARQKLTFLMLLFVQAISQAIIVWLISNALSTRHTFILNAGHIFNISTFGFVNYAQRAPFYLLLASLLLGIAAITIGVRKFEVKTNIISK